MKYFSFLLASSLLLASCGGKNNDKTTGDSATVSDSSQVVNDSLPPDLEKLASRFAEQKQWPFVIDSLLIDRVDSLTDSLRTAEVKLLSASLAKNDLNEQEAYTLKEFYRIDSLKSKNAFGSYSESLDLGMTKNSKVYSLARLRMNDHQQALIWGLTTCSYEACPFSSEKAVFASLISDGKIEETMLLGKMYSAGDAPVWMRELITGSVDQDGKISLASISESDEGDDKLNTEKHAYTAEISKGKFAAFSKKEISKTSRKSESGGGD